MSPTLDPQAEALLEVMRVASTVQPYELPVAEARARMRASLITRGQPIELQEVRDLSLPAPHGSLAMRLYRPAAGVIPVALFLHGGGWVLNDLDTHDHLCRRLARRSGCLLASLDYRRAPEHQHPAPLEDALVAYRWLLDNALSIEADASRVSLVGESSGGATVACLAMLLRDLAAPLPVLQALVYPVVAASGDWPSYRQYGHGYTLDLDFIRWALESYLPPGRDHADQYLFPLSATDLKGLPPALVMTAEFDPLRDAGIAYAGRLAEHGVSVEHLHAEDQMHGFLLLDRAVPRAGDLIDRLGDELAACGQAACNG